MSSLDALRSRYYDRKGAAERVVDDTPIVLKLRYIGTGTVTSVVVTTATDITLTTSDGGTDAYTWANFTTVGALVAAINGDGIFEAVAVDSLLADATGANLFVAGTLSATTDDNGVVCYEVKWDTSYKKAYTVALTPFRNFNPIRKAQGHRVHLYAINYYADVSAAEAGAVRVYLRKGQTEKLVWSIASVDTTDTAALNLTSGNSRITSADGGEIIVRVQDATSLTNHASGYLQVLGEFE